MTWQVGAAVIGIWSIPLEPMLVSLGRPGDAVKVRLIVSVILLAALVPIVQTFGLTGAGAALVAAMAGLATGMFVMLQFKAAKPHVSSAHERTCVDSPAQAKRIP
jgi:O-antigen/teichoic acid export membrane protein